MEKKLWGGRFKKKTDPRFERFGSSFRWDARLLPYDLRIDAVHVAALRGCGVLTAPETSKLLAALRVMEKKGLSARAADAEDVHSAIQGELSRLAGPVADKLHAARSRNDLVSQSMRLYGKDHAECLLALIRNLQRAVVAKAEEYQDVFVPGMTHLQNAQVVSQAHIFLAYAEMLDRAIFRFSGAVTLCDVCVLGSGALAGVGFALDQKKMAKGLGLGRVTDNSYDVSGDRDFALNLISSCAFLGTHLSRIAEDLMIAQLKGQGLVDIDQSFCTGSSMMPQKKNADFAELVRGAAGILVGNLHAFLVVLKGLPTSYNRDLQWDKRPFFESIELCEEMLEIFTQLFKTLKVNAAKAAEMLEDESLYATDLADYLVRRGVPFRQAHADVGKIVGFAEENGVALSKIGLDILQNFNPRISGDVYALFGPLDSVRSKKTQGSTNPQEVKRQINNWKKRFKNNA